MARMKKRNVWVLLGIFTLILCMLPAVLPERQTAAAEETETVSGYPYTTVTRVKVNLRASRSVRSTLLRRIPAGAEITVLGVKGSWAEVDYGKYTGYVMTEYIVLKTVQKTAATPTPTPVPTLSPEENAGGYIILRRGSTGREVTALQEAMIELGFLTGTADGVFGAATENAVIAFQRMNQYPDTGLMDANIQAFLYSGKPKNAGGAATQIQTASPAAGVSVRQGKRGVVVREIQTRLQVLGYYVGGISGFYDADTRKAVAEFQKKSGLKSDGVVGSETLAALQSDNALTAADTPTPVPTPTPKPTPEPTPAPTYQIPDTTVRSGTTSKDAKTVQRRLRDLGYYQGKIDGIFGRGSVDALKRFQKASGLTVDGVAGKRTIQALFSSTAKTAQEAEATPAPTETPAAEVPVTEAAPAATPAAIVWTTLRRGSSGQAVSQLQEALIQLGYLAGKPDGKYGDKTVAAVRAFQRANGLKVDGAAGEATQKMLYGGGAKAVATPTPTAGTKATPTPTPAAKATPTPTPAAAVSGTLRKGDRGEEVRELQRKLIALGFLSGSADGIYGSGTTAAVTAFQKANQLTADGIAGSRTLARLNSVQSSAAPAATATPSGNTGTVVGKPSAAKVIYANWYTTVKNVCRSYPYATIYDYQTGISWQIHIFSCGAHGDYEPLTANDTAKMLKVFGKNTWNPRPVWVIFADGSVYMASTHSNPHGTSHITDNNFNGHSCLHFPRTQEQVTNIGPYATSHQETIDKGWAATQTMK